MSKLEEISLASWREIGGHRLDNFCFVPARGSAGGIIIGWNSAILTGTFVSGGTFSLTVKFFFHKCEFDLAIHDSLWA